MPMKCSKGDLMPSGLTYSRFDSVLERDGAALLRLTFLLSREKDAARELAFQSLLRLAVRRDDEAGDGRIFLLSAALRLCEDWFARKLRKKPGEEVLRQSGLPFEVSGGLTKLLASPFARRAAAALAASGMDAEAIRQIAGGKAAHLSGDLTPEELGAAGSVTFGEDDLSLLSDRVYERFAERSVSVENAIHEARIRFDRAAPWLALAVLLFFAFCIWFSLRTS